MEARLPVWCPEGISEVTGQKWVSSRCWSSTRPLRLLVPRRYLSLLLDSFLLHRIEGLPGRVVECGSVCSLLVGCISRCRWAPTAREPGDVSVSMTSTFSRLGDWKGSGNRDTAENQERRVLGWWWIPTAPSAVPGEDLAQKDLLPCFA